MVRTAVRRGDGAIDVLLGIDLVVVLRDDDQLNWVLRNEVVTFAVEQVRRRIHALTNREHLVTALKKAVDEHVTGNTELEVVLGEAKAKALELRDRAKRTYLDHSKARSDSERAMTREAYDAVHEELTRAEYAQERLEADLVLRGIANEDQTISALAYLERFDRFLNQLPPDQLRRTFDALGVRLDIQFEANQERGSRRLRMPVGGTMSFGAQVVGQYSEAGNDSPPADAEGGSSNDTWLGCGGGKCTQISSPPPAAAIALRATLIRFAWMDIRQAVARAGVSDAGCAERVAAG